MKFTKRSLLCSSVGLALGLVLSSPLVGHSQPAPEPGAVVLTWRVQQALWGEEVFTLRANGQGEYRFTPVAGSAAPVRANVRVTTAQLEETTRVLTTHNLCRLVSTRMGVPDEGRPTLRVELPGLRCSVTLWDGEWRDNPHARACERAVRALHGRGNL